MQISNFMKKHFKHFNAASMVDASDGWAKLLEQNGKMFLTLAGAMSTAELGISLAEMIRKDKVHAISCTGANLEEDIFNLVKPIFDKEADITIGSRYKGTYNYKLPIATRLGEAILEVIIILLFWQKVKNNQGGFRAFHRKTESILENIKFKGYAFTTELILYMIFIIYQ